MIELKLTTYCITVERALQLERAGLPCSVDCSDSPRCANRSLTYPAGHNVSINGGITLIKSNMKASESGEGCILLFSNSRWQCYSSHHQTQRVCYSLLLRLLRTIDAEWDPAAVRGDLVGSLPPASQQDENLSSSGNGHLISSALHWHSSRFLVQPKMCHSQHTQSYNWGPFLCPGEAAVRQLQAVHRALPVSDEEHASGFPLHQRRCHYTLRAHAQVKSHYHRITSHHLSPRETHRHSNRSVS